MKHWINSPSHGGTARVYRLFLPTGWRGLFHNVLLLSPYLELRERFPYLTHSCKSQLNSSNSEKELQTRLLSIWTQGSSQSWSRLWDHLSLRFTGLITSKDCSKSCSALGGGGGGRGGVGPAKTVLGVLPSNQRLLFYLAFQNYTVYSAQEVLIFLLMQQLNFLNASLYTTLSCKTHESPLGFVVPLLDFLWYVAAVPHLYQVV